MSRYCSVTEKYKSLCLQKGLVLSFTIGCIECWLSEHLDKQLVWSSCLGCRRSGTSWNASDNQASAQLAGCRSPMHCSRHHTVHPSSMNPEIDFYNRRRCPHRHRASADRNGSCQDRHLCWSLEQSFLCQQQGPTWTPASSKRNTIATHPDPNGRNIRRICINLVETDVVLSLTPIWAAA